MSYKFVDFRVTSLKDWLIEHRGHTMDQVIGTAEGKQFRFIKCVTCEEVYYNGKTTSEN